MKFRWILGLALAMLLAMGPGCSDDDETTGPGSTTPTFGTVNGRVSIAGGAYLEAVDVTIGNLNTTTNEDGWFAITSVPVGENQVVEFALAGYLSTFRNVEVRAAETTNLPDVELLSTEMVLLDAAAGGEAATSDGDARANFPANAFVTEAGLPYTGDVEVEITASVPEDSDFYDVFPGAFEGETETGETVPFVSFGFMGLDMYSDARGEPLELADGVTAQLAITVSSEFARMAPATIPMWWFDEARGVWVEEGEATLVGDEYVTEVEHFTIWNWDLPITDICLVTGQVQDLEGNPVPDARVFSQGLGCTFMDEVYTDAGGLFSIRSIMDCEAAFWALKGSYASQNEEMVVGTEDTQELPEVLVLAVPALAITLAWGENPDDLDSHLLIPMTWDANYDLYHVYYSNEGGMGTDPYTCLDTDDTTSYGPEIISGTRLYPGTYSYYVHHYSGISNTGASPATVTLEVDGQYQTWNSATAGGTFHDDGGHFIGQGEEQVWVEDFWHVFDLSVDAQGNVNIISRHQVVYAEDNDNVGDSSETTPWGGPAVAVYEDWRSGEERDGGKKK